MANDHRNGFAKIRNQSQKSDQVTYAGCGFLIEPNYLVTCCHVLETAIGKEQMSNGLSFVVDFPFISGLKNTSMELVSFYPKIKNASIDDLADMALLKFTEGKNPKIDYSSPPVKYLSMDAQEEHEVEIYSTRSMDFVKGKCQKAVETGWIVIDTKTINVEPGDSGSPIWNKAENAITGMLVARYEQNNTCYLIPTVKIQQAFKTFLSLQQTEELYKPQFPNLVEVTKYREKIKLDFIKALKQHPDLYPAFLQQLGLPVSMSVEVLAEKLLEQTEQDVCAVISDLSIVIREKLTGLDEKRDYQSALSLIKQAELIVNSLTLLAINQPNAQRLQDALQQSINLTLPHRTYLSAETISAHRYQSLPQYTVKEARIIGKHATHVAGKELESGIKQEDIIEHTLKKLWERALPNESAENYDLNRLRSQIRRELKAKDLNKKNFYLVVSICANEKSNSPLANMDTRQRLSNIIPELPILILDNNQSEEAYLADDEDLEAEIYNFFDILDNFNEKRITSNASTEATS